MNSVTPAIRNARGATSQTPSQETARNRIEADKPKTTCGQIRSTKSAAPAAFDNTARPEPSWSGRFPTGVILVFATHHPAAI